MFYSRQRPRRSKQILEYTWPAPVAGLLRSSTLLGANPAGCEVLDNYIPTAEGAVLRGGSVLIGSLPDPVVSMFSYRSGSAEMMFGATENAIYLATSIAFIPASYEIEGEVLVDADDNVIVDENTLIAVPTVTGQTSGDWSHVQFATPGGQFLCLVNGADDYLVYDGSDFNVIDASSTPALTNVLGSALSFVWSHKRRLWFVEDGTLSAWYLPVNSIAGAAVEFPLDGVFSLGGALLFGGTWSQDSGDGLDDLAVFVTTEGQIAVYQGTDPSDAASWSLVGVYRIGKPLGKNAWFRAGGDFVILTEDGIVSVSEALRKDRAALQAEAITAPIEDLWQEVIAQRSSVVQFPVALWSTRTTLFIGTPKTREGAQILVANTRTGAWATVTGWPATAMVVFQDQLYYGDAQGRIVRADVGGSDQGQAYIGTYVPKFQEKPLSSTKLALHAQLVYRAREKPYPRLFANVDYQFGSYPDAQVSLGSVGGAWGVAVWGQGQWGAKSANISRTAWQAVAGQGVSLSVGTVVASQSLEKPTFEIIGTVLRYEAGRSI